MIGRRKVRRPVWGAYGANGSVVPMPEAEMPHPHASAEYFLAEALRSLGEGVPGEALTFARAAAILLEIPEDIA